MVGLNMELESVILKKNKLKLFFFMIKKLVNYYYDPLEQFDFLPLVEYHNLTIINNLVVYCALILFGIVFLEAQTKNTKPSNLGILNKKLFEFVKSIVKDNVTFEHIRTSY